MIWTIRSPAPSVRGTSRGGPAGVRGAWWLHLAWALLLCRLCYDAGMDMLLVGPLMTAVALILGRHTLPLTF